MWMALPKPTKLPVPPSSASCAVFWFVVYKSTPCCYLGHTWTSSFSHETEFLDGWAYLPLISHRYAGKAVSQLHESNGDGKASSRAPITCSRRGIPIDYSLAGIRAELQRSIQFDAGCWWFVMREVGSRSCNLLPRIGTAGFFLASAWVNPDDWLVAARIFFSKRSPFLAPGVLCRLHLPIYRPGRAAGTW